jgi:hypothetical protein
MSSQAENRHGESLAPQIVIDVPLHPRQTPGYKTIDLTESPSRAMLLKAVDVYAAS